MNGSNGIVPTVDLATNNTYPYPIMYGNNGGFGSGMFGGDGALWLIVLLALIWNGNGGNGFLGGNGNGFDNGYAWLSNGQKEIMTNTNNGFDTLHLSNQLEGIRDDVNGVQNAICSSTASINSNISNGFYSSEIAATNRQMANMQQAFNNQLSTLQSFNGLERQLCECCADNRLATANLTATVLSENCADRAALQEGVRDIIQANNNGVQKILDRICQDKIDEKNDTIAQLRQEILYARGQASQVSQTADIRAGQAITANQLVAELRSCPIPSMPVYGNQAIFTCPNNNGCGCGNYYGTNII